MSAVTPAPASHFLADSFVFDWKAQYFRADFIFILPMAVFKVLSKTNNDVLSKANAEHYLDFVRFLSALAARFPRAKIVADMIDKPTDEIVKRSIKLSVA